MDVANKSRGGGKQASGLHGAGVASDPEQQMSELREGAPSLLAPAPTPPGESGFEPGPAAMGEPEGGAGGTALELAAVLQESCATLESYRGALASGLTRGGGGRADTLRLELALLEHLLHGLVFKGRLLPTDAVLIESLLEYGREAEAIVADLQAGGVACARRLLAYVRELLSAQKAHGVEVTRLKARWQQARSLLVETGAPSVDQVLRETWELYNAALRSRPE